MKLTASPGLLIRSGGELREDDATAQRGDDHPERDRRAHLEARDLGAELEADEAEHDGHGLLEVDEIGDGHGQELVEASQPDDGGDVGGVHDEGVVAHGEHGGDRVDREDDLP
eukprot:scaffold84133_cov63-Phaeocystis_antarctica.AAC.1